jgi:DNA-binding beta-propeller fold protein YncE
MTISAEQHIHVTDEHLHRVTVFDTDGDFIRMWGEKGDEAGQLNGPAGVAVAADGTVYVAEQYNHRVQRFTSEGEPISHWGEQGDGAGQFNMPWGVGLDTAGNVYVADWRNDRIQKFTADGQFLMKFGTSGDGEGQFNRPTGVAVDRDGDIYVTDYKNDRVQVFTAEGRFTTVIQGQATLSKWGRERLEIDPTIMRARQRARDLEEREGPFQGPISVAVDDQGRIFVAEVPRHRVQVFHKQSPFFMGDQL